MPYDLDAPDSLSITSLQTAYSSGSTTPVDVVRALHSRIESYSAKDPAVWIDRVPFDDLLAAAEALQAKHEGKEKPALYGVPFSVKNSIDVKGYKTTLACPTFAYVPDKTAPVVERVLEAGGLFVGTTNLDQFATGLVGHRSPYGTPRCVKDSEYISGGSSSGSAVSVGAGLCSFSIATDTAGSTRVPASLNGLIGLKPTLGTLSTVGLIPACKTADCITVLAKNVDDAEAACATMRAYGEEDAYARSPLELAGLASLPRLTSREGGVRFATPPQEMMSVLSDEYAKLWEAAVEKLEKAGSGLARAERFDYTPFDSAEKMLYGSSIVAQRSVAFDSYLQEHGYSSLHPVIATILSTPTGSAIDAYKDLFQLADYKRKCEVQFRDNIDVLVVPSTTVHWKVKEVDEDPIERNKRLGKFTHFVNLVDLCAVSVPAGTWTNPNGNELPFGVTFIAMPGRDEDILELARRFQSL
ncbi:hypothetical protein JCM8547_009016 [Rhodosporidiobolus lusitaniae]